LNRTSGDLVRFVKRGGTTLKILLFAGLLLVVLGIASLVVPIPHSDTHGIKIGDANIGVQTSHSERMSPIISVVLIAGGIALTIAGARSRT
jgi:hypothetical protein